VSTPVEVQPEIQLSAKEIDTAMMSGPLKVPARAGIFRGAKFLFSTKIGGRMEQVMVVCKGKPHRHTLKNGKKAWYVDIYGYGVRRAVNITKLRERPAL